MLTDDDKRLLDELLQPRAPFKGDVELVLSQRCEREGARPAVIRLCPGRAVVGRERSMGSQDLQLQQVTLSHSAHSVLHFVSRRHLLLDYEAGQLLLRDLSTHGTFVNGRQVSEHRLREGNMISLGNGAFEYIVHYPQHLSYHAAAAPHPASEPGAFYAQQAA